MVGEPTIIDVNFVDKGLKALHQMQITLAPNPNDPAGERDHGEHSQCLRARRRVCEGIRRGVTDILATGMERGPPLLGSSRRPGKRGLIRFNEG